VGLARQLGGELSFTVTPGAGAAFEASLPRL
jgi:C4-dicarboxylate-specific signal transduction histidine kinase